MKNNSYFSTMNAIQSMAQQTFVNQKLDFVEELVLFTNSHIFLTGRAGTGKTTFLKNLPQKTYKRMVVVAPTGVAAINAGYITLTTHNYQADEINKKKLDDIQEKPLTFNATIHGNFPENTFPTKEELVLKKGAQVMFVKNDPSPEKAFYNGKIGQLVGYDEEKGTVTVKSEGEYIIVPRLKWQNMEYTLNPENQEVEETEVGSFTQIPLRLAWAVTIHKSQGLTFDRVIVDAGHAFAHGQVYVALSRCTSFEGLFDLPFKTDNQAVNEQLTDALKLLEEDITIKESCLEACKNGFTVKEYQKTKSIKSIEKEKNTKKKVEIKDDVMDKSPLYAQLRAWRSRKADELGTELYTIIPNKPLKLIAQEKPVTLQTLKEIEGMGPKRVTTYGAEILDIVLRFMGEDPETTDIGEWSETPKPAKKQKGETYAITKEMLDKGMPIDAIAKERGFAISTIYGHLAQLVEQGSLEASQFIEKEKYNEILDYFESTFDPNLAAAKDVLGDDYQYDEIKAVLAELQREHFFKSQPNMED